MIGGLEAAAALIETLRARGVEITVRTDRLRLTGSLGIRCLSIVELAAVERLRHYLLHLLAPPVVPRIPLVQVGALVPCWLWWTWAMYGLEPWTPQAQRGNEARDS